jgi:c-di-GMP-binding flagellar brake protein YcgR
MTQSYEEKRNTPRIYFENDEKISAAHNGIAEPFFVDVLNLSSGGMQFSQSRAKSVPVKVGDHLSLIGLNGLNGLGEISDVTMEVRWVIDQDFLGVISAGCQFLDMSDKHQQQIQQMIDERLL